MEKKKLSTNEVLLVKERAKNRIIEQITYSAAIFFIALVAPVFPFKRGRSKSFPSISEYFDMIPGYMLITGLFVLYYWARNKYLNDILFKKKVITTGKIVKWVRKKNNYGDVTYELVIETSLGLTEQYLTFEKHLGHFQVGQKYQFHVSKNAKVLVNIARVKC